MFVLIKSSTPRKHAPAVVGIDKKKENFAASNLEYPKKRPAVKVIPDLLTPGIREIIWNKPITKEFFRLRSLYRVFEWFILSLINKIIPKIIKVSAIILIEKYS